MPVFVRASSRAKAYTRAKSTKKFLSRKLTRYEKLSKFGHSSIRQTAYKSAKNLKIMLKFPLRYRTRLNLA